VQLGGISYSFYLLHSVALVLIFHYRDIINCIRAVVQLGVAGRVRFRFRASDIRRFIFCHGRILLQEVGETATRRLFLFSDGRITYPILPRPNLAGASRGRRKAGRNMGGRGDGRLDRGDRLDMDRIRSSACCTAC
jgi:hypothetical protein